LRAPRLRSLLCALALVASEAFAEAVTLGIGLDSIPATLLKPEGAGPFPAVVMLHDCSGLGPRSSGAPGRWARQLVAQGYVVILPDSFGTRGYPNGICTDASKGRFDVRPIRRARDARAARAFLQTLPYVAKDRIGLMGGSHGGASTLATLLHQESGFVAAVALYPRCRFFEKLKPDVPCTLEPGDFLEVGKVVLSFHLAAPPAAPGPSPAGAPRAPRARQEPPWRALGIGLAFVAVAGAGATIAVPGSAVFSHEAPVSRNRKSLHTPAAG